MGKCIFNVNFVGISPYFVKDSDKKKTSVVKGHIIEYCEIDSKGHGKVNSIFPSVEELDLKTADIIAKDFQYLEPVLLTTEIGSSGDKPRFLELSKPTK